MFQLLVTKAADKFQGIPSHARLLPFSVETTGGMARDAIELLEQVSLACRDTQPWEGSKLIRCMAPIS